MIAYGSVKRGSGKLHSHNKCAVCGEKNISKGGHRKKIRMQMKELRRDYERSD